MIRFLSLFTFIFSLVTVCIAQTEVVEEKTDEQVFMVVEVKPIFPGGQEAFFEYLAKNIKYPEAAKENGITGTVIASFIVSKDGSIRDIRVLRGIGAGCDKETLRVLNAMPSWQPAMQRGKAVNFQFTVPVRYILNSEKKEKKRKR